MSAITGNRKTRVLLLIVAAFFLASYLAASAVEALRTGSVLIHFGKSGHSYIFVREHSQVPFFLWVGFDLICAALFAVGGAVGLRALAQSKNGVARAAASYLSEIEQKAPSDLRPLWIGLAIALAAVLIYVSA